ncbi:hypothetical protein TNCT_21471 [Trichonephila clavata]|uniref:Uncharacterized protein n=1 Tax=Trichonephila clavata TaxID=2740835 RepID=A0A8X6G3Q4_TRICU|nr:hypothetical protein TNCT_21471 [Trichonephila clavata]
MTFLVKPILESSDYLTKAQQAVAAPFDIVPLPRVSLKLYNTEIQSHTNLVETHPFKDSKFLEESERSSTSLSFNKTNKFCL